VRIGTILGRIRIRGFAIGATACTLIVAVVLGQFGTFVIPSILKSILFGLFVFTIGYRSGPEFFAGGNLGHAPLCARKHGWNCARSNRKQVTP
jgi:putative transport protein